MKFIKQWNILISQIVNLYINNKWVKESSQINQNKEDKHDIINHKRIRVTKRNLWKGL